MDLVSGKIVSKYIYRQGFICFKMDLVSGKNDLVSRKKLAW